jgi:cell division septation protein DedD
MTTSGSSSEPSTIDPKESNESKQPSTGPLLIVLPITLSVGLFVAAAYIAGRISASKSPLPDSTLSAAAPAVVSAVDKEQVLNIPDPPVPIQFAKAAPKPESQTESITDPVVAEDGAEDHSSYALIDPQPGDKYIQIAAISSQSVPKILSELHGDNIQASVAAGPSEGVVRILVGPFPDENSLGRAKTELRVLRPGCFVWTAP